MGKKVNGNGEGTLYKSAKTGLYVGQYVVNGKRKSVYQKKNEKIGDFKKRFNDVLSSIHTGTYIEKSNETLYNICKEIIEDKKKANEICPNTYRRATYTLAHIKDSEISDIPVQKINSKMLKDYLT